MKKMVMKKKMTKMMKKKGDEKNKKKTKERNERYFTKKKFCKSPVRYT